jgi:hypothetical protein
LEFCQWIKAYFEKHYSGAEYDALGRRKNQELYYIAGGGKVAPIGTRPGQQSGMVPRSQPTAGVIASKPSAAGIVKPVMSSNSKLDEQIIEMRL